MNIFLAVLLLVDIKVASVTENFEFPWPTKALINSYHYQPFYNPNIDNICSLDVGASNWTQLIGNAVGIGIIDMKEFCDEHHQFKKLKARTCKINHPEYGYDECSSECLHLFQLEHGLSPEISSRQIPRIIFPRGVFLHSNHSESGAAVCVVEYIDGISLDYFVSQLQSLEDILDLILSFIELLSSLSKLSISHRDITPDNLLVILSPSTFEDSNSGDISEVEDIFSVGVSGKYSLSLIDFTWASSPFYSNIHPTPAPLGARFKQPESFNDVYSAGFVLYEQFLMYADLNCTWTLPLIHKMTEIRPPKKYYSPSMKHNTWSTEEIEKLYSYAMELADAEKIRLSQSEQVESSPEDSLRRETLCSNPNMFAPKVELNLMYSNGTEFEPHSPEKSSPVASFRGYQSFDLVNVHLENGGALSKFNIISEGLLKKSGLISSILKTKGLVLMDIGGNFGFFCYFALASQAKKAILVDMDTQYTTATQKAAQHLGPPFSLPGRFEINNKKLKDMKSVTADVVIALALIHWSFNCSERRGSLARTLGVLAAKTRKVLIVEWIDPMDSAIRAENHTGKSHNMNAMPNLEEECEKSVNLSPIGQDWTYDSPYTFEEFMKVMKRLFDVVKTFPNVTPTRKIFIGIHRKNRHRHHPLDPDGFNYNELSRFKEWDELLKLI